jgi:hypothetical protein
LKTHPSLRKAWLPDGLFSYQKSQFGYILESLGMENVNKLFDHFQYFKAVWLWPFGTYT